MPTLTIWNEESLEFERQPDLFVLQHSDPIIWTTRGIRHFAPRLQLIGVAIHAVQTRADLHQALRRWNQWELRLLEARIRTSTRKGGHPSDAHRCLTAIMDADPAAENMIECLDRGRCGNRVTPP